MARFGDRRLSGRGVGRGPRILRWRLRGALLRRLLLLLLSAGTASGRCPARGQRFDDRGTGSADR